MTLQARSIATSARRLSRSRPTVITASVLPADFIVTVASPRLRSPSVVKAVYHWDVATTNPILNLIAPLAKGALARNHERVMANGYAALRPHVEG